MKKLKLNLKNIKILSFALVRYHFLQARVGFRSGSDKTKILDPTPDPGKRSGSERFWLRDPVSFPADYTGLDPSFAPIRIQNIRPTQKLEST